VARFRADRRLRDRERFLQQALGLVEARVQAVDEKRRQEVAGVDAALGALGAE
jgi:hypothetical protein